MELNKITTPIHINNMKMMKIIYYRYNTLIPSRRFLMEEKTIRFLFNSLIFRTNGRGGNFFFDFIAVAHYYTQNYFHLLDVALKKNVNIQVGILKPNTNLTRTRCILCILLDCYSVSN